MKHPQRPKPTPRLLSSALSVCFLLPAGIAALSVPAFAQTSNASVSGTVTDSTGAIIPNAPITLTNVTSGATRVGKSNGSGFFTFAGVPSGDYSISISAPRFEKFTESGIHLDPGDSRNLPSLSLKVGAETQTVTVEAENNVPIDSGELSDLISSEEISHLSVEGRDVTELLKTLPGFAITQSQGSVTNQSADLSQTNVGGAAGNYSANGSPVAGITLRLDGGNVTDPGNFGGGIININYDQVAEVKVQVSNFGSDVANGPVIISAVTKQGGDHFRGSLYTYARTNQLDSNDALNKATGLAKAPDREIYPGGTFGGPVLIPGTNFNHNRRFTFFAGAEDLAQRNVYAYQSSAGALVHALVPTVNMRNGNFSQSELQTYLGGTGSNSLYNNGAYQNIATVPTFAKDGSPIVNGMISSAYQDPGFKAIFANYPIPNQVPTLSNPYNWQAENLVNDDLWQVLGRADIAISDRNHFFARYSTETGVSGEPGAIYYNQGELNSAGGGASHVLSQSVATNLTTIINPTLTNTVYGNLGYFDQYFFSPNIAALQAYPYQGAFANGRHPFPQLGNYDDASGLPRQLTPDYSLGPEFARKLLPEGGDNVSKVWGTHTATFGVYMTREVNNQVADNADTNGSINQYYLPGAGQTITDPAPYGSPAGTPGKSYTASGNWVGDDYEGFVFQYSQQNLLPDVRLYFWNNDFFAQDQWKVTPRFTLNYGMRFEHLGLWNDAHGKGLAIFDPNLIAQGSGVSPFPGFLWHQIDKSIPLSGNASTALFFEPRAGFALDVFGTGKTLFRGGFGEYRYHDSNNDVTNSNAVTQGVQSVTLGGGGISLLGVSQYNEPLPSTKPIGTTTYGVNASVGTTSGLAAGDRQEPLTDNYSMTINQALPHHLNALVGYVGNNSRFILNTNPGSPQPISLANVNSIPIGGLYKPNPDTASACYGQVLVPTGITPAGAACNITSTGASTNQVNNYRPLNTPLVQYGELNVARHNVFANYNALQLALTKQTGRILFNVNYTFSKALGVQGALNSGEPGTPFQYLSDYGPEGFDRSQIFNATYTFELGNPVHQKLLGQFTNGWELSGITNLQSGPDIVTTTNNPGFGVGGNIGTANLPSGAANPNYISISNTEYLGTPSVSLQPILTCNPRSGVHGRTYINASCFNLPALGTNGQYQFPYIHGPAYFDTDLSLQKAFNITREQNIQFRFSAFNFINHGLPSFTGDFPNQYTLNLTNTTGTTFTQGSPANAAALGFGTANYEVGRRVIELMAKYNF